MPMHPPGNKNHGTDTTIPVHPTMVLTRSWHRNTKEMQRREKLKVLAQPTPPGTKTIDGLWAAHRRWSPRVWLHPSVWCRAGGCVQHPWSTCDGAGRSWSCQPRCGMACYSDPWWTCRLDVWWSSDAIVVRYSWKAGKQKSERGGEYTIAFLNRKCPARVERFAHGSRYFLHGSYNISLCLPPAPVHGRSIHTGDFPWTEHPSNALVQPLKSLHRWGTLTRGFHHEMKLVRGWVQLCPYMYARGCLHGQPKMQFIPGRKWNQRCNSGPIYSGSQLTLWNTVFYRHAFDSTNLHDNYYIAWRPLLSLFYRDNFTQGVEFQNYTFWWKKYWAEDSLRAMVHCQAHILQVQSKFTPLYTSLHPLQRALQHCCFLPTTMCRNSNRNVDD